MKKRRLDRQQDFIMWFLRPIVTLWMKLDTKRKVVLYDDGFSLKRKEPYIMLANHTFLFDVIHVPLRLKKVPFIVASHTLFKKKATKFLVTQVAHVISKSKGQSDAFTVREIIGAIKRGYPVLIFPEGDTTFYGETNYIEEATMKLVKKLGVDVVTCNVRGGYLSKPRWALSKRENRYAEFHYKLTIKKEDIDAMSIEEVTNKVKDALYHNAYDFQRENMIKHHAKELTKGLEDVIYVCSECNEIHTIETYDNKIKCNKCNHEGYMDDYGFIQNFKFDNLIDWNNYQRKFKKELMRTKLSTTGILFYQNQTSNELDLVGNVILTYDNHQLCFLGALNQTIHLSDITNPTITVRRDLGFYYENKDFLVKLDHYGVAFLRILQDKY
jgi:1-acyl-sn-glycerol-3-phosphate acyltransferase